MSSDPESTENAGSSAESRNAALISEPRPGRLERESTVEEWERGRAARRAFCDRLNGGRDLRRPAGDPRKDALLRRLNNGERGLPFGPIVPPATPPPSV